MKNIQKNILQYKTTLTGIILFAGSAWFLYQGKINAMEFILILPTILILLGINDKAFTNDSK